MIDWDYILESFYLDDIYDLALEQLKLENPVPADVIARLHEAGYII